MFKDDRFEPKIEAPVKLEPWRQACLDGAEYIRQHGWCQGTGIDGNKRVCLLGSLLVTVGYEAHFGFPSEWANKTYYQAATRLGHRGYDPGWNDSPNRTKEQVIVALEETARAE
jgi:hypothetical protein